MKNLALFLGMFYAISSSAALLELKGADDFDDLVNNASVPVMVQFSAYWCGPCQDLKATVKRVASDYSDSEILLAYVDAYVNKSLGKYLKGGYPTVRTFNNGKLRKKSFVGSKSASYVRNFIDSVIRNPDAEESDFLDTIGPNCAVE